MTDHREAPFVTEEHARAMIDARNERVLAEREAPAPTLGELIERLRGRAEWIDRQYPRTGLVRVEVRQDFMAATAADLREATRALTEMNDAKAALAAGNVGGIYDVFDGLADAVRQMVHYIDEQVPPDADRISDARTALAERAEGSEPTLGDDEPDAWLVEVGNEDEGWGKCGAYTFRPRDLDGFRVVPLYRRAERAFRSINDVKREYLPGIMSERAEPDGALREALEAMFREPHNQGSPMTGPRTYATDSVIVTREWYERLRAPAAPQRADDKS